MKRFWAFFFGIIFGWVLLFGGIAVAAYTISLSTFNVDTGWEDKDGNDFDQMSIATIITKGIDMISSGNLSLQQIEDTYGIDVLKIAGLSSDGADDPYASLRTVSLTQLISNPANALSEVRLGDIADSPLLQSLHLPEGLISAWTANGATMGDIIKGDFATVLNGITIRDIMPNFSGEGITGILSGKDLGALFTELKSQNADPVGFILEGVFVGDIMNYKLNKSEDISAYTPVIDGEILQYNTDFYKAKTLDGVVDWYKATFNCDNTEVAHVHDKDCYRFVWSDKDNITVSAITGALANLEISTLLSGNNLDFGTLAGGMYIGDIMNYTKTEGSWYNGDNKVDVTTGVIADIKISDIVSGNFNLGSTFDDLYIGDLMNYTKQDGDWYNGTNKVDATTAAIADIKISDVMNGNFNLSNTFDGLFIGDLLGYNYDSVNDVWTKEGGIALSAVENAMARISVSNLTSGNFDINSVFNGLKVGDLMGYSYNETESKWYNGSTPVDALMTTFAGVNVSDMLNGTFDVMNTVGDLKVGELLGFTYNTATSQWEKGTNIITDSVINSVYSKKINEMDEVDLNGIVGYMGSLMGFMRKSVDGSEYTLVFENIYSNGGLYAKKDGEIYYEAHFNCTETDPGHSHNQDCYLYVWYTDSTFNTAVAARENNMANLIASDLTSGFNIDKILKGLKLGDILGYELNGGKWYNNGVLADELTQNICNMEYSDLKDGFDVMSIFGDTKLGTLMGYTFNEAESKWYHGGTEVDSIKQKLAQKTLSEIQSGFDIMSIFGDTKLGELMGYTFNEAESKWYLSGSPVDSIKQKLAEKTLSEIQSGFDIISIFGDTKLGELMGYTLEEGIWYNGGTQVDTLTQAISDQTLSSLQSGFNINTIFGANKVGDLLGYTYDEVSGKWQGSNGTVDPISQNLCSKLVSEITGGGLNMDDLISGVKLSDIITIDASSPAILRELAEVNVKDIGTKINTIYLGDLQNYERKAIQDTTSYSTVVVADKILFDGANYVKYDNGVWYEAILNCSQTHTHTENCFDFVWYTDATFTSQVTGIQKVMVNMTVANVDVVSIVDKINDMPFSELFTGDTTTGALSLIPADTTIRNLPDALSSAIRVKTIGELMDANLLTFTPEVITKLNQSFGGTHWRNYNVEGFISYLVTFLP